MIQMQPQLPGKTVYVSFSAEINATTKESLIAAVTSVTNQGAAEIYLMLSTPGGAVMNGMTLYNTLRALPVKLTTHNMGNVDSIGNAVFLAGEERYACAHSTFMFHGVAWGTPAAAQFEEKVTRERLDSLQADQRRIGSVIEERTKLKGKAVADLFLEAQTKDAAYAVSNGIVNEIRDVKIPVGATIVSLVFQRQGG